MRQNFPSKLLQSLPRQHRSVRFCVIMEQPNFSRSWSLLDQSLPQSLQLSTVQLSVHGGVAWEQLPVNDALEIPPHGQHLLQWVKVPFRIWFWLLAWSKPLALLGNVHIGHPLLIAGDYLFQEFFLWIPRQQRVAGKNSLVTIIDRQFVRYPHSELVLEAKLLEMIFDS